MNSTSTPIGPVFSKVVVEQFLNGIDEGTKQAARMLWGSLTTFLSEHWLAALLVLFFMFVAVTLKAMMGRWGSLGSFLYNVFYFGTLFVVGLIWGPEVFVNDIFKASCAIILYPICYIVTGKVLDRMGVRKF